MMRNFCEKNNKMVFSVAFLCIFEIAYSLLLPPRSLQINYISSYEEYKLRDGKHLAMVEIVDGNNIFKAPIFSWKIDSNHEIYGDEQTSYFIQIYDEDNLNKNERELIYESKQIISKHPICNLKHLDLKHILLSLKWKVLSFRVKWKNTLLQSSDWSNYGRFILTSGSINDWNNASYIAHKTNSEFNERIPLFRKEFITKNGETSIKSAIISVVGLGFFRLWVNNNDILAISNPSIAQIPGWTNTDKRVPYVTFDITSSISISNNNDIIIALGIGYRNTTAFTPRNGRSKNDIIDCILKVQLIITYNDNSQQIIITDNLWQTALSGIEISSIYNGEIYNEYIENEGIVWTEDIIVLSNTSGPPGILYNSVQPYVSIIGTNKPINIYNNIAHKSQIIDFQTNSAGIVKINIAGLHKNTSLQMHFAEIKQHPNYGPLNGDLYYDNLRSAAQFDQFIASGKTLNATEAIWWQPLFTIHGFQFVEIWGYPRNITSEDIFKLEIHANLQNRSKWTSSDKILNNINIRCINGQLSNLQSVVTDCDQRDERLGWMGDAGLTSNTMSINFDMTSFYSNWLLLMQDDMSNNGAIPDVVPWYRYGNRPSDPNWGIAFPQIINVLNIYYNMTSIAYQYMTDGSLPKYIENLKSRMPQKNGKDNIAAYPSSYGDWVAPPPNPWINSSFAGSYGYIKTVQIVLSLCYITNCNTSYENYLISLNNELITEFIEAFYNGKENKYLNGLQTSYIMALEAKIYSDDTMKVILENGLISQINKDNNLLTTGIIGTKFILPILAELNNQSLALKIIKGGDNHSYPSWSYEGQNIYEPASAVWELWNGDSGSSAMDSRNHHAFTTISQYFNTYISGLIQLKYNKWKLLIAHLKYKQLKWSNIIINDGLIKYHWKWIDEYNLQIHIIIPVGHSVIIQFDHMIIHKKWFLKDDVATNSKKNKIWNIKNIIDETTFLKKYNASIHDNGNIVIGSGKYKWKIFYSQNKQ